MGYFIIETDADKLTAKESIELLEQIISIKSFKEITESEYTDTFLNGGQ